MYEQKRTEVNKSAEKFEKEMKAAKRSGNRANQVERKIFLQIIAKVNVLLFKQVIIVESGVLLNATWKGPTPSRSEASFLAHVTIRIDNSPSLLCLVATPSSNLVPCPHSGQGQQEPEAEAAAEGGQGWCSACSRRGEAGRRAPPPLE